MKVLITGSNGLLGQKLIDLYKKDFDYLITGHTHHCCYKEFDVDGKKFLYMNCGDWIDNCAYGIIDKGEVKLMIK
jgi:UDP-2,3-diacylglucosamine pyrophosphatase LpxH